MSEEKSFEERASQFVAGLRDLTERTGIVAVVHDEWDGSDEYSGSIELQERTTFNGQYEFVDRWVYWNMEAVSPCDTHPLMQEREVLAGDIAMLRNALCQDGIIDKGAKAKIEDLITQKQMRVHDIDVELQKPMPQDFVERGIMPSK